MNPSFLTVAVPKGRILKPLAERLRSVGVAPELLLSDDRTLVREDASAQLRFLLLKPDDVPTYVEYGIADLGIVGRDVLLEQDHDLYAPLDLELGLCKLVVAGKAIVQLLPAERYGWPQSFSVRLNGTSVQRECKWK